MSIGICVYPIYITDSYAAADIYLEDLPPNYLGR